MDQVAIVRVFDKPSDEEIEAAVREAVDMIGGPAAFASKGDTVLVKPNWWWKRQHIPQDSRSDAYSTTDRRMVVAAARLFSEMGCRVKIGEDPECFLRVEDVFDSYGAAELAAQAGAEVVNMRRNGFRSVPTRGGLVFEAIRVLTDALDADLIVNVPLMKTNFLTTITCCLKNMKGTIPPPEKRRFHQLGLDQGIADLATVVQPGLNIVEAVIGNDVWDIDNGTKPVGCIIAGDNPLSTDAVVARIMDYDPSQIEHLAKAYDLGVGELDIDNIQLVGVPLEEVRTPFTKIPDAIQLVEEAGLELVQGRVCSSCLGAIAMAMRELGEERFAGGPDIALITGLDAEPVADRLNIFVGACTRRAYQDSGEEGLFVKDCPPTCASTRFALLHALGERPGQDYYWDGVELAED